MEAKEEGRWFKPRVYGFGWTPISWQGWASVSIYLIINIVAAYLLFSHQPSSNTLDWVKWLALGLFIFSSTLILVGISIARGGMPHWQWGEKSTGKRK
jgi:hypothetical protein